MSHQFHDVFLTSGDGLRLHAVDSGPRGDRLPVLCLPGLTRTTTDFTSLMQALADDAQAPRRAVALDYRGRGLSDPDLNSANYNVGIEMSDVLAVATHLQIARAIIVGTSRGGLIAMTMAATKQPLLAGVVLNDIGPEIALPGLLKIKGYVGRQPQQPSLESAAARIKAQFSRDFPSLDDAAWLRWARRSFREVNGVLQQTYDPALAVTLEGVAPDMQMPAAWEIFDALAGLPLMLVHGLLSDLLTVETANAMKARRPDMEIVEVADQGHAPLLDDAPTIARIAAFCRRCDGAA